MNNNWRTKRGVYLKHEDGSMSCFDVEEVKFVSSATRSLPKNYVEFHDANGMKLSFPRNSFFITERTDGGATIHLLERMIFWQVRETYEEAMKKVEE